MTESTAACAPLPDAGPRRHVAALIDAIEQEVIPRLVLARRVDDVAQAAPGDAPQAGANCARPITANCIRRLRDGLLSGGAGTTVDDFVDELLGAGVTVDEIFSDLMAPCARELGLMWERDEANFAEVTLGLGRLQQMLRELSYDFVPDLVPQGGERRVVLASPPGEQHTFGVLMVAEYFRRDGWEVLTLPLATNTEVEEAVRNDWFAVAGLSAGSSRGLDALRTTVSAVRRASLNPSIRIMVGGAAFTEDPGLVASVGADASATDARRAPVQANRLLGALSVQPAVSGRK
jgi:methanogenic corrinoid protein MtbC1